MSSLSSPVHCFSLPSIAQRGGVGILSIIAGAAADSRAKVLVGYLTMQLPEINLDAISNLATREVVR